MTGARLLNIRPVHPGRGEPSRIEVNIVLDRKNEPVVSEVITTERAVELIEELARAIRAVSR